jgi:Glu-tRNA(Gln) amidotransferase subunit E-like FAD-binding protein
MDNSDLAAQVIQNVRGDREAIHKIAEAILSKDHATVKRVLSEVGQVEVSREAVDSLINDREVVSAAAWT